MKAGFYPKLAWSGIRKNSRLYTPYILTCTGMVMMFYIISFVAGSDTILELRGGDTIALTMRFGQAVMGVFALIFLFYTNSFLIRRRKKEFGLYNVLGMGKGNIARILAWEALITAAISLAAGLIFGVALSKLAELCLINIMLGDVSFSFSVSINSIVVSIVLFAAIFFLIFLNDLRQIRFSNPAELLRGESVGEKPPKANWFFGVLGAVILAAAYYIAVTIKEPLSAMLWFFVAVIMVIVATYMLFIAGSVVMCRMLQKKKNYYYKANHFVSVSSMVFRMKRNGAGLASICILATMVLVMISSTACLYFGAEDSLSERYPNDLGVRIGLRDMEGYSDGTIDLIRNGLLETAEEYDGGITNIVEYSECAISGVIVDGELYYDSSEFNVMAIDDVLTVYFVPLADYNRASGKNETLDSGEVLIYPMRTDYPYDTFAVKGEQTFRVKKLLNEFPSKSRATMDISASIFVVTDDIKSVIGQLAEVDIAEGIRLVSINWNFSFDSSLDDDGQIELNEVMWEKMNEIMDSKQIDTKFIYSYSFESRAQESGEFYGTYGGLFFLGIMLSIVFLFAAVLIIYYKQVSEGYEDSARFDIMQKVGMTKKNIRKSINSQLLTVFFLPLIAAGMHLAFAFPMLYKILMLFNLRNTNILIVTTLLSFLVFALFYMVVYRITSGAYFAIVSGAKEERV